MLQKYGGREGQGEFRAMTFAEAAALQGGHIWFLSTKGDARRAKVNGAVRRWKRDATRIEVPIKYGMREYTTFDARDIAEGRLLVEIVA